MTEQLQAKQTIDIRKSIKRCPECAQRFSADAMFCPFCGQKLEQGMWDPRDDGLLGQVVDGRYELVSVIGEGGMGKVYRVRHVALDRGFAMKVLRKDLARDAELAERFIQEARTTASVRHPNIVSINDFGKLPDDVPYFVMELLSGEPLGHVIKSGGPLPAGRAAKIIEQIAGGLGAAHAAGIVHRDLKPDNVFLLGGMTGAKGGDDVRVVDFGAAKIVGKSRMTKQGIVFGTPHYMAPEQASGAPVDHRADVYALGIIMYEMFTGKVPFEADTYMGVLTQHMFVKPTPPSQICAEAKELGALEDVCLRALEKKPEDRFGSMEELAAEVARVVKVTDGIVQVAKAGDARASRPPKSVRYKMADELELPSLEEMRVAVDSVVPPKRGVPVVGVIGGAFVVLAGLLLLVFALTRPEAPPPRTAAGTTTTPTPTTTTTTTTTPTPTPTPTSTTTAAEIPTQPPTARPAPRPAPRPQPAFPPSTSNLPDPFAH